MKTKLIQKPCAEDLYKTELERLIAWDSGLKPPGWKLSPIAIEKFILGDSALDTIPRAPI